MQVVQVGIDREGGEQVDISLQDAWWEGQVEPRLPRGRGAPRKIFVSLHGSKETGTSAPLPCAPITFLSPPGCNEGRNSGLWRSGTRLPSPNMTGHMATS